MTARAATGAATGAAGAATGAAGAAAGAAAAAAAAAGPPTRNEVLLLGRVSGEPEERELPSGDLLVSWRVVVPRPVPRRPPPAGVRLPTVDTLDCVAWAAGVRRTARGLVDGEVVAVEGALRRRFWRAGAAAVSRCEVEVSGLRRVGSRAARERQAG